MFNQEKIFFGNYRETFTPRQIIQKSIFRLGFIAGFITAFLFMLVISILILFA